MAVQTVIGLRAALCAVIVTLSLPATPAMAEDAAPATTGGEVARPSVEELAIPGDDNKAAAQKPPDTARETDTREAMCLMIESAARANDLPLEFFARVIWQESRFQSDAVGPVTRSGQRAQGIAQFMPGTANERRLLDPFDPVQALPKSAEFLSELRNQFGNLGLAAAAYNAGPRRVQEWLAGTGPMPQETRNYVVAITGTIGRRLGHRNQEQQAARPRAEFQLPRVDGIAAARPQFLCHPARTACDARRRQAMGRTACRGF